MPTIDANVNSEFAKRLRGFFLIVALTKTALRFKDSLPIWSIAAGFSAVVMWAQTPAGTPEQRGGFSIDQVATFGDYYSAGLRQVRVVQDGADLSSDLAVGGAATFSLRRQRERTALDLTYSPSYTRRVRYSDWDNSAHQLMFHVDHHRSARLRMGFALSANVRNTEDFQFSPTRFSTIASGPGTAGSLADALADPSASSSLGMIGQPSVDSGAQFLLYGNRVLVSNANANVSYSLSPRLTFSMGFGVGRMQHLNSGSSATSGAPAGTLSQVSSGMADIGISYSLSPRTNINVSINSTRQQSAVYAGYVSMARLSIDRSIGQRWFVQSTVGPGLMTPTFETGVSRPSRVQYTAGGGVGFRGYAQTWLASYDRRIGDMYGTGAGGAHTATATWRWARPGRRWWLSLIGSGYRLIGSELGLENWRGTVETGRVLSRSVSMSVQYSYMAYTHTLTGVSDTVAQSAVRVALLWAPFAASQSQ